MLGCTVGGHLSNISPMAWHNTDIVYGHITVLIYHIQYYMDTIATGIQNVYCTVFTKLQKRLQALPGSFLNTFHQFAHFSPLAIVKQKNRQKSEHTSHQTNQS